MWSATNLASSFRRTVFGDAHLPNRSSMSLESEDAEDDEEDEVRTVTSGVEQRWKEASFELYMRDGPKLLIIFTFSMLVYRVLDKYGSVFLDVAEVKACMKKEEHYITLIIEIGFLIVNIAAFYLLNFSKDGYRATWRLCLYYSLVLLWSVYMLLLGKFPFSFKCEERRRIIKVDHGYARTMREWNSFLEWIADRWQQQREKADKGEKECNSLYSNVIVHFIIVWILGITPQLFQDKKLLKINSALFYISYVSLCFGERLIWGEYYEFEPSFELFSRQGIASSLIWIGVAIFLANAKKTFLDKGQRAKFISDQKEKEACEKIFNILEFMVPLHVIVPMLLSPGSVIAKHHNRASILFIMFTEFDQHARRLTPEELLSFLNRYFTEFDHMCTLHDVTKIETVGEEYVCAVGVGPADEEIDERDGHGPILGRLVRVASDILRLQASGSIVTRRIEDEAVTKGTAREGSPNVEFKMGIHTGPIVAGVIGHKLPRFRLFGDTINTAARMMQKGMPGEVQFGEETMKELPEWVRFRERGDIEMKGKGLVKTFLLDRRVEVSPRKNLTVTFREPSEEPASQDAEQSQSESVTNKLFPENFLAPNGFSKPTESLTCESHAAREDTNSASQHVQIQLREIPDTKGGSPRNGSKARTTSSLRHPSLRVPPASSPISTFSARGRVGSASTSTWSSEASSGVVGSLPRSRCTTQSTTTANLSRRQASQAEQKRQFFQQVMREINRSAEGDMAESRSVVNEIWTVMRGWEQYELEESFQKWFHQNTICKKFEKRLARVEMSLFVLTALECIEFQFQPFEAQIHGDHLYGPKYKLLVFLLCRGICVVILGSFRATVVKSEWYIEAVSAMQRSWLAAIWAMTILVFVSYDALSSSQPQEEGNLSPSTIPVRFFVIFILIINNAQFLFVASLTFVLLGILIILLMRSSFLCRDIFLTHRANYVLIIFLLLNLRLDFTKEKNLRARYKAQRRMEFTRERINLILNTLMPPLVVQELREMATNAEPPSHHFYRATIAQSDLVGFTKMASTRQPREVVEFIGELFGRFDALTDKYDIYKVETVGDAYIAGQAEEPLTYKNSPLSVVLFGLEMVKATREWAKKKGEAVSSRVGVHFGECIGGIVGTEMQRYHLFGELMSQLEVLESTAGEGRVQVSQACKDAVDLELRVEGIPSSFMAMEARAEAKLVTSKGEAHDYSEVGGTTYLVRSYSQFLGFIGA